MKVLACICLVSCAAWGQEVAQISGTVTDQTGAVIPNAQITAIQTETGAKRTVVSDNAGFYAIPNLPLGPYRIEAMNLSRADGNQAEAARILKVSRDTLRYRMEKHGITRRIKRQELLPVSEYAVAALLAFGHEGALLRVR